MWNCVYIWYGQMLWEWVHIPLVQWIQLLGFVLVVCLCDEKTNWNIIWASWLTSIYIIIHYDVNSIIISACPWPLPVLAELNTGLPEAMMPSPPATAPTFVAYITYNYRMWGHHYRLWGHLECEDIIGFRTWEHGMYTWAWQCHVSVNQCYTLVDKLVSATL